MRHIRKVGPMTRDFRWDPRPENRNPNIESQNQRVPEPLLYIRTEAQDSGPYHMWHPRPRTIISINLNMYFFNKLICCMLFSARKICFSSVFMILKWELFLEGDQFFFFYFFYLPRPIATSLKKLPKLNLSVDLYWGSKAIFSFLVLFLVVKLKNFFYYIFLYSRYDKQKNRHNLQLHFQPNYWFTYFALYF